MGYQTAGRADDGVPFKGTSVANCCSECSYPQFFGGRKAIYLHSGTNEATDSYRSALCNLRSNIGDIERLAGDNRPAVMDAIVAKTDFAVIWTKNLLAGRGQECQLLCEGALVGVRLV